MFQALGAMSQLQGMLGPQPTVQGSLTKLGFKSGKWQKRYFSMIGNVISYANDKGGSEKGQVILDPTATCEVLAMHAPVPASALAPSVKAKAPVGACAFQVCCAWKGEGQRSFVMLADSEGERDAWIAAIRTVLGGLGGMPSPPPAAAAAQMGGAAAAPGGGAKSVSGKSLPSFPATPSPSAGLGSMMDMLKMATSAHTTMKQHQDNPLLSKEDNALALAQGIKGAVGLTAAEDQRRAALKSLEALLPSGYAGFVVTEPPGQGTLGMAHGLMMYDLIFAFEGQRVTKDTTQQQFAAAKTAAFQTKGSFALSVYSFVSESEREVVVCMPPGLPNAVLGLVSALIPVNDAAAAADSGQLVAEGWANSGGMFISNGQKYPIEGPCTPANAHVYVKIFRQMQGMMVGSGQYHPLYNYTSLAEPLFVEAWMQRGGIFIQSGGKYAPLPMTREHVSG